MLRVEKRKNVWKLVLRLENWKDQNLTGGPWRNALLRRKTPASRNAQPRRRVDAELCGFYVTCTWLSDFVIERGRQHAKWTIR